ncbi:MAG: RluA family pseudouridine synthase [Gudongella sp.]|nr:RluA family pseudouridine synthase [Gudongella sp.]
MEEINIYVNEEDNERLDFYLASELDEISRSFIKKLIKEERIFVNKELKKASYLVKEGDQILVELPEPKKLEIIPQNLPIEIVYEDEYLAVVNKPQGMVVHPAPGNYDKTLVNALLYHLDKLSSINGIIRPGIVHRLDKDTSGLLVVAKNDVAHRGLSEQLKTHSVQREYIALVHFNLKNDAGTINAPIGRDTRDRKKMAVTYKNSKEAITHYKVLKRYNKYTLISVKLETGRTHQIRVHFSNINHPIVGDPVYSKIANEFKIEKQLLHSKKIAFTHPITHIEMIFECELPIHFTSILERLEKEASDGY